MYCYVIFGNSKERHTRHYLYECSYDVQAGDTVIVPTKDSSKIALVLRISDYLPDEVNISDNKIKHVFSLNDEPVSTRMIYAFLLAVIDDCNDSNIEINDAYALLEHFVSSNELVIEKGGKLEEILTHMLPEACLFYIDEPGDAQVKKNSFMEELKEIEYWLRYGYSYREKIKTISEKVRNNIRLDTFERMTYLRSGGKLACPFCNDGVISMINRAVFTCNKCGRGIVATVRLNDKE